MTHATSVPSVQHLVTRLFAVLSRPARSVRVDSADPGRHLLRLAETSPHLLSDAGFAPDPSASTPDTTVWTDGTHRLRVKTSRATTML